MKCRIISLLLSLATICTLQAADYDITKFGAVGDGNNIDTQSIQAAIDACTEAGGGRVVVPGGKIFIIGTIHLKSNVTLYLENGSTLRSTTDYDLYTDDTYHARYKRERYMNRALIYAEDANNICIEGKGVIDGNGHKTNFGSVGTTKDRPMLLRFLRCNNFDVKEVTIINPASWTTDFIECDGVTVTALNVVAQVNGNGAALCFDCCQNVQVTNCDFDTSDDSVAITTSKADIPSRNMVFSNCNFKTIWSAFRIGLMSLGDIENVAVTNCTIVNNAEDRHDSGFKIQMNEGAEMKNMVFSNIIMKNVTLPIFMTFCQQRATETAPEGLLPMKAMHSFIFDNIIIDNSELDKESMMFITGLPDNYLTDIQLNNIQMVVAGGGTEEDATKRQIKEFDLETMGHWWPEYLKLETTLPASGLYARHANNLYLNNIHIRCLGEDARSPIVLDDVPHAVANEIYYQNKKVDKLEIW